MIEHNLKIIEIKTLQNAKDAIRKIGSDPESIEIMAPKAILKVIRVENVVLQESLNLLRLPLILR